ncbi:hypothetical protein L210DRAFT_3590765 [Boletus edulis BED1]|uniref:Uncharacterized protein n=1 Tax=Boletus edulis BED1 TaxID=1328754 RepID=A0AAD4BAF9_BOLED|nr:hypothetical protein L210DRAFT_3590765 [Boletus edulis BED1]
MPPRTQTLWHVDNPNYPHTPLEGVGKSKISGRVTPLTPQLQGDLEFILQPARKSPGLRGAFHICIVRPRW